MALPPSETSLERITSQLSWGILWRVATHCHEEELENESAKKLLKTQAGTVASVVGSWFGDR